MSDEVVALRGRHPLVVHGIGWSGVIFFGLCLLGGVKALLNRNMPGLIFTDAGLTENSGCFIPWEDIKGFSTFSIHGQKFLVVLLHDPEKYLQMGRVIARNVKQANYKFYGSPICLGSSTFKIFFDEMMGEITSYYIK